MMSSFAIEIGLAVAGVLLLAIDAFTVHLNRRLVPWLAIGASIMTLVLLLTSAGGPPPWAESFYTNDGLAQFYKVLSVVATLVVLVMSLESDAVLTYYSTSEGSKARIGEFYALPLIICAGMMWMASARDLIAVFVPLELVTITFYVLVAFTRRSAMSLEAGVKYLILGALSTGILVYGMAWLYGATGTLTFEGLSKAVANPEVSRTALLFGAALVLAGLGFKVGAAPFHFWIPDVYQGAPTPVTGFLSVASKAAGFVVLTRVIESFTATGSVIGVAVQSALLASAVLTILLGSLPAIFQTSLKRLMAYSSISHAGFLLLALACAGSPRFGLSSSGLVAFYLATYLPMTMLGFLVICLLRSQGVGDELKDLTGLAKRQPGMAFALTVALASMAGLPLTAGFMGKMLVFMAAVDAGHYTALALAVVGAAAGFYYYFRPILAVYSYAETEGEKLTWTPLAKVTTILLIAGIVVLGVYPKALTKVLTASKAVAVAK
jgi:NADH-quinone oxidoreductase subunit N